MVILFKHVIIIILIITIVTITSEKACKTVYKSIIEKKATTPLKSQGKWLSKENIIGNANVNWENTYRLPFLCTTETKLRVFQFMFLHRRIATNDFLFKIGLKQADSCSFCGEFTETLAHLFWYCSYIQKFWKDIYQWITQNTILNKSIALYTNRYELHGSWKRDCL